VIYPVLALGEGNGLSRKLREKSRFFSSGLALGFVCECGLAQQAHSALSLSHKRSVAQKKSPLRWDRLGFSFLPFRSSAALPRNSNCISG